MRLWLQVGVPPWHTPEEMQAISNAAHAVEGVIIGAVALIALAQASGHAAAGRARLAWPSLLLVAGLFLLLYLLLPHHGFDLAGAQWRFIFGDPQQRQHVLIAFALMLGGWGEVMHRRHPRLWSATAFPIALLLIGLSFLLHTQHGTAAAVQRALLVHRWLGIALTTTAALAVAARTRPTLRWLHYAWPIALLTAAVLLFVYREPKGAFHDSSPHDQHINGGSRSRRPLPADHWSARAAVGGRAWC